MTKTQSQSAHTATIDARPEPITIDMAKTAVLVIDMQNDFGSEGGMFDRAGVDISGIRKAIEPTAQVLASARKARMPVVYLKMGFRPDLSDFGPADAPNHARHLLFNVGQKIKAPDGTDSRILIRDTWNTEIVSELAPQANDIVLYKHRYSGFYETELDSILKERGVLALIVTGCTTSVCVESTIRDAMFRDYSCVLLEDCTAEPIGYGLPRSNHEASMLLVEMLLGWTSSSNKLVNALEAQSMAAA